MFRPGGITWNDLHESAPLGYYVEYGGLEPEVPPEQESVPEPSSILGLFALGSLGVRSLLLRIPQ
ncbi:PEP-CTERM sorting domain-containing protein [Dapis sp. BLCC M172]|uniref:PEP-CTERM sorting domain-containing protein n=1 Tax=Dapis sp. BLCC M172 TaxID=2975281 RepID=UPI003CE7E3D1